MSVRHAILAILTLGDCYGYQLRSEFDRRTGSPSALNVGQIYNTLDRLQRDGLVTAARTDTEGHQFYTITADGRRECAGWFGAPTPRSAGGRDEIAIKIALAMTLPDVDVTTIIHNQRAQSEQRATEIREERDAARAIGDAASLPQLVALESTLASTHAELAWLDAVEAHRRAAVSAGASTHLPLASDPVKRGRPVKLR